MLNRVFDVYNPSIISHLTDLNIRLCSYSWFISECSTFFNENIFIDTPNHVYPFCGSVASLQQIRHLKC